MDSRRQALGILGRTQGLELSEADRKRDAIYRVFDAYAMKEQRKKAAEAGESGFFGSGGGTATGTLIGTGIGALVGGPPGAMIGGMIGGGAGGVADVAMAPGSPGAAAGTQQAANLPRNLMAYDQYYGEGAQNQRQASVDLMEARTRAADRSNQAPPLWTEDLIKAMFQGYVQGPQGAQNRQKPQRLITDPTYTSLGLR
jgi:hypothetical protein